jgi:hypothetical protein
MLNAFSVSGYAPMGPRRRMSKLTGPGVGTAERSEPLAEAGFG